VHTDVDPGKQPISVVLELMNQLNVDTHYSSARKSQSQQP
jgi:hypothetical protein